jgi:hypothetical protein
VSISPKTPLGIPWMKSSESAEEAPRERRERRRTLRHSCCGSITMQEEGAASYIATGISDISLTGCYVELLATLPIGTSLSILLRVDGVTLRGTAEVRTSHPGVGMGLEFQEMGAADKAALHQLINRLSSAAKS